MALESLFIRVTHAGSSAGAILLNDVDFGFDPLTTGARQRRPGAVYVPSGGSVLLALSSTTMHSYESGSIRQFVDAGELTVSLVGGAVQVLTFLYDFDVLGGAVGTVTLTGVDGEAKQLPAGAAVMRATVDVQTAAAGGSSQWGTTADTDGFVAATAAAALTADAIVVGAGALIETKNTTATDVELEITGAPLTAGKFLLHLEVLASI